MSLSALGGDGFVPGIPRLGIPSLQLVGASVGVTNAGDRKNGYATALPSTVAETASWDPALARDYGAVIGRELRKLQPVAVIPIVFWRLYE